MDAGTADHPGMKTLSLESDVDPVVSGSEKVHFQIFPVHLLLFIGGKFSLLFSFSGLLLPRVVKKAQNKRKEGEKLCRESFITTLFVAFDSLARTPERFLTVLESVVHCLRGGDDWVSGRACRLMVERLKKGRKNAYAVRVTGSLDEDAGRR